MKFILSVLSLVFLAYSAHADFVVPSDRVQSGVVIRTQPTSQSAPRGILAPGQQLLFEGTVPRWNRVRLEDGTFGYVSKSWTDVIASAAVGSYTLHAVDVGTGLAIIVEGPDFVAVYDGGSNDDLARGNENRLLAYLRAALPNLQTIDHLILSHPHRDHVELLPDIFDAYDVRNVWDSGRLHMICGYRAFLEKVSVEPGVVYHNALGNFGTHKATFPARRCYGQDWPAATISIAEGARIGDAAIELGTSGRMKFLYADGAQHSSPNENSLVVRLDLGGRRILFMGDAEAGGRQPLSEPAAESSIEGSLLACCTDQLRSDVLIVGHHGSMTSSRTSFLNAVNASAFVISSGPKRYGSVTLPDQIVIDELTSRGTVWRTDLNDAACGAAAAKIGPDNDGKAGGCNNVRITIDSTGAIAGTYWTTAD